MKKILFVHQNIPIPGYDENPVLLELSDLLERNQIAKTYALYPKEKIIRLPWLRGRAAAVSRLSPSFIGLNGKLIDTISYYRLPSLNLSYRLLPLVQSKKIIESTKASGIDLVHAHHVLPDGYIGKRLSKILSKPLVVTFRQGDMDKMLKLNKFSRVFTMYVDILKSAQQIVVHNCKLNTFLREMGLCGKLIPHWTEFPESMPTKKNGIFRIVTVSRLIPRKRIEWLIEAAKSLQKDRYEWIVIGQGPNIELYRKIVNNENLNMHFVGKKTHKEVMETLEGSHCFVLCSKNETFGRAYIEAASRGCYIIGATGEGVDGWLDVPAEGVFIDSSAALKNVLQSRMDSVKWEYEESAWINTAAKFSEKNVALKYAQVYDFK